MTAPVVLVLATLDTKGAEAARMAGEVRAGGVEARLLDLAVFGPATVPADIARDAVAHAAGTTVDALRALPRADALAVMATGACAIATGLLAEDRLAGVLGLGGSQGTVAATRVMAALPFGLPKVMLSTMASGDTRPYVGTSDITMVFPVVDLAGLNRFCRAALDNAARAVAGMARAWRPLPAARGREAAITMFGATTPCAARVAAGLRARAWEPVVFHANGIGGRALEAWLARGEFGAVLDLTPTELADELVGGLRSAGPDRLEAAGRRGLPQVVAPGAIDMVNFGPPETVPPALRHRLIHRHNAGTTLVRTTAAENAELGRTIADKLARAGGARTVLVPRRGFSAYDVAGGPFFDPAADAAFVAALRRHAPADVAIVELDAHINDPEFADAVLDAFTRLTKEDA